MNTTNPTEASAVKVAHLIPLSSPQYAKRLVREINRVQVISAPTYRLAGSEFDGRRIMRARFLNGCVLGLSLNGDEFPVNVECVFDWNGNQICASREH